MNYCSHYKNCCWVIFSYSQQVVFLQLHATTSSQNRVLWWSINLLVNKLVCCFWTFNIDHQFGWTSQQKNRCHFVHHLQQHKPSWVDFTTDVLFLWSPLSTTQTLSNQVGWTSQQKNRCHFVHHLQQHKPSWVDFTTDVLFFWSPLSTTQTLWNQVGWTSQQKNRCHFVHHLQQHKPSWVDFTTKEQMSFCSSPPTTQTKLGGLHNRCSFLVKSTFNNTNIIKPSWVDFTTKEQMSFCSSPPTTQTKLGGLHNRCSFLVKSTFNNTNIIKPSWVDFTTKEQMTTAHAALLDNTTGQCFAHHYFAAYTAKGCSHAPLFWNNFLLGLSVNIHTQLMFNTSLQFATCTWWVLQLHIYISSSSSSGISSPSPSQSISILGYAALNDAAVWVFSRT